MGTCRCEVTMLLQATGGICLNTGCGIKAALCIEGHFSQQTFSSSWILLPFLLHSSLNIPDNSSLVFFSPPFRAAFLSQCHVVCTKLHQLSNCHLIPVTLICMFSYCSIHLACIPGSSVPCVTSSTHVTSTSQPASCYIVP